MSKITGYHTSGGKAMPCSARPGHCPIGKAAVKNGSPYPQHVSVEEYDALQANAKEYLINYLHYPAGIDEGITDYRLEFASIEELQELDRDYRLELNREESEGNLKEAEASRNEFELRAFLQANKDNGITGITKDFIVQVDTSYPALRQKIEHGKRFDKQGKVTAVRVTTDTAVTTTLADGTVETTNTAHAGDWIVTNPGGEQYTMSDEKFTKKYASTDESGVFKAIGTVRAIKNPLKTAIIITAPWGEEQHGGSDCWLAYPDGTNEGAYIIGGAEFNDTYGGENKGY